MPPNEPDIRGATAIRKQLARHRRDAACESCQAKIDPPGFALESFEVIGGYREFCRTTGQGKSVAAGGRRIPYLQGAAVDPADQLPDGRTFANVDDFKQRLLEDRDQFAMALQHKLLTYATGKAPQPEDRPAVEAIVAKGRETDYGLRSLVHAIVQRELFQTKWRVAACQPRLVSLALRRRSGVCSHGRPALTAACAALPSWHARRA